MPLKDFLPEYKPLARFAGYLALAAAVFAPTYLSNREHRREVRELREFVERLEESRGQDMGKVRNFLDRYVGVVEGMGKGLEGHDRRIVILEKAGEKYTTIDCYMRLEQVHNELVRRVSALSDDIGKQK